MRLALLALSSLVDASVRKQVLAQQDYHPEPSTINSSKPVIGILTHDMLSRFTTDVDSTMANY